MRRWLIVTLLLTILSYGCSSSFRHRETAPASLSAGDSGSVQPINEDLSSLSFVEKNNLYLDLLEHNQSAGVDTQLAENAYMNFLESSLAGEDPEADRHLLEAIQILIDQYQRSE